MAEQSRFNDGEVYFPPPNPFFSPQPSPAPESLLTCRMCAAAQEYRVLSELLLSDILFLLSLHAVRDQEGLKDLCPSDLQKGFTPDFPGMTHSIHSPAIE